MVVIQVLVGSTKGKANMHVSDEVRQCTVFLARPIPTENKTMFVGSAFLISIPTKDPQLEGNFVYLVTAKHVIDGVEGDDIWIRGNTEDGKSDFFRTRRSQWWKHPTDATVDVAVLPSTPPSKMVYKHVPLDMFLTEEIITEKQIGTGDEVFLTGLFAHLSGSQRNLPIVRMGNIAMMPDEPIPTPQGPIDGYLIEARSIGGLSGSPVFVRTLVRGGTNTYLMGLMHGHWDIPPENRNDTVDATGANQAVNMGIAIVVPTKKILEVINQEGLVDDRERKEEVELKKRMNTI